MEIWSYKVQKIRAMDFVTDVFQWGHMKKVIQQQNTDINDFYF